MRQSSRTRVTPPSFAEEQSAELARREARLVELRARRAIDKKAKAKAEAEQRRKDAKQKSASPKRATAAASASVNRTKKKTVADKDKKVVAKPFVLAAPPEWDPEQLARDVANLPDASRARVWDNMGARYYPPVSAASASSSASNGIPQEQPQTHGSLGAYYANSLWSVGQGDALAPAPLHTMVHDGDVRSLALSADHAILATCSDVGTIRLWQVPVDGAKFGDGDDHSFPGIIAGQSGLASVAFGSSWPLLLELHDHTEPGIDEYYSCMFSPNNKYLFAAGKLSSRLLWSERDANNRVLPAPIKIFDLTTGHVVARLWGHAEEVWDFTLLQCALVAGQAVSNICVSCGEDGRVIRWLLNDDWSGLRDGPQHQVDAPLLTTSVPSAQQQQREAAGDTSDDPMMIDSGEPRVATAVQGTSSAVQTSPSLSLGSISATNDRILPPDVELQNGSAALQFCSRQVAARKDVAFIDDDSVCCVYRLQVVPDTANRFVLCAADDGAIVLDLKLREDDPCFADHPSVPHPRRWAVASFPGLHATQCDDVVVVPPVAAAALYEQYLHTDRVGHHFQQPTVAANGKALYASDADARVVPTSPVSQVDLDRTVLTARHVFFFLSRGIETLDDEGFLASATSSRVVLSRVEIPDTRAAVWRRATVRELKHRDYTPNAAQARMACGESGLVCVPTNNLGAVFCWSALTGECGQLLQLGDSNEPVVQLCALHPLLPVLLCISPREKSGAIISVLARESDFLSIKAVQPAAHSGKAEVSGRASSGPAIDVEDAADAAAIAAALYSSDNELLDESSRMGPDGFDYDAELRAALADY